MRIIKMVGFHSIEFKALLAKQSVKMTCFRILLVFNTDVIYAFKSFPFFFLFFFFPLRKRKREIQGRLIFVFDQAVDSHDLRCDP